MIRQHIADILQNTQPGETATICGWVRTRRDSKQGFSFVEINDGSCMKNLQVVIDADVEGYHEHLKDLTTGASVRITGEVKDSPGQGQRVEMQAGNFEVLGLADAETYPLQKKRHSFEFLREIAHLRPRTNTFGAIARVRNAAAHAIHTFFFFFGFLYVQTIFITCSECEGGGSMFQDTTLDLARLAEMKTQLDWSQDFFGKPASLTVSGQLEAETFATSLGPCYTFGPTFRAENSNTTRHLAEFWMVEPEVPFIDLQENMQLAEEFVRGVVSHILTHCADDMEFFNQRIDNTVLEVLHNITQHDFIRVPYTEAIQILADSGQEFEYPIEWGRDLQSEHERFLTEQHFKQPIIVYDYPRSIKPFYMRVNDDGRTVRAMDVLVPRVGEIIGGSQREERLDVLTARMEECGLNPGDYWWYLDLRRYGTVPHAGFGLGLERLIQLVTGMVNIRDCIPFARTPKNAAF